MRPLHRLASGLASAAVLSVALAALAGCAPRTVLDPQGVSVIRTYQFATTVSDPQPSWNPVTDLIVARTLGGFALLQEGNGRQELFVSQERRQTWFPVWINRDQFVFGPDRNVVPVADGRVVAASDGLTIVNVVDSGQKCSVTREAYAPSGFRPKPSGDVVYAQVEDRLVEFDRTGRASEAGQGFDPSPQVGGPGFCWRDKPYDEPDRWTGKAGRGTLFIRWRPGQVTEVPGGCQARWTADGGVVCTVLKAAPVDDKPWWSAGTDVVHVRGPGAAIEPLVAGARDPAPHPKEPVVAVTDGAAGVVLAPLRAGVTGTQFLTAVGGAPLWNNDGTRLLVVQGDGGKPATIVVNVLKETRTTL